MTTETTNTDSSKQPLLELEYEILQRNYSLLREENIELQTRIENMKRVSDAWNGKKKKVIDEIRALHIKLKAANKGAELNAKVCRLMAERFVGENNETKPKSNLH